VARRLVRFASNAANVSGLPAASSDTEVKEPDATTLLSFCCTSAHAVEEALSARTRRYSRSTAAEAAVVRGCQVPPKPAHSVSTLSTSRASLTKSDESSFVWSAHLHDLPGLFHPGNTPVLSPSGLCSSRRSRPVSGPPPSMPFYTELSLYLRLRRFDPSEKGRQRTGARPRLALLAFSSLRLSSSLPWNWLPSSSSHTLDVPSGRSP
jgi:hypothetical protein